MVGRTSRCLAEVGEVAAVSAGRNVPVRVPQAAEIIVGT